MRQLAINWLLPCLVICCAPLQNTSYHHASHFASMNLSIFYGQDYNFIADEISCRVKHFFAAIKIHLINSSTSKMDDICGNPGFAEKLRFAGLIQVTVTIGRVGKDEAEAKCNVTANLLHLKALKESWLAHLITRRSDLMIEIGGISNDSIPIGLSKALQLMMVISGPVLTLPEMGIYKRLQEEHKRHKAVTESRVKVLLGVGVSSLVAVTMAVVAVVGTIAYKRRVKRKDERAMQMAEKTNEEEQLDGQQVLLELPEEETASQ